MKKSIIFIIIIAIILLITIFLRVKFERYLLGDYIVIISDSNLIGKDWNEKNINEQFIDLNYNNRIYASTNKLIDQNDLNKQLDITSIICSETPEKMHKQLVRIFSIKNISKNRAIAIKFEDNDNYYMYSYYTNVKNEKITILKYDKNTTTTNIVKIKK